ncbi:PorV/PorQ family protein [candidate division KSB1 bacterium]|nr:PorV/PorQ family protein [candidate division KSB1 bacterium]
MKKKIIPSFIIIAILCAILTMPGYAMKKVAQSKLQFLKLEMGARAVALGGAYAAVTGDPNCIFYNPAGIAFVEGIALAFNHSQWLADISYQSGVAAYNTGRLGTISLNYITVNYGTFERTIVDAHAWEGYQSLGDFEVGEYAAGLGYAVQITDRFYIGAQVKYAYQKLGSSTIWEYAGSDFEAEKDVDNETDVVAYDFGTYYNSGFKNLCVGMAVQNFANKPIPLNFRFGLAIDLNQVFLPSMRNNRFTLSCDVMHPRDYEERLQYGLEYQYKTLFAIRGGYKANYDEQGLCGGVGMNLNIQNFKLNFDYAVNDFGLFDMVQRFSVGLAY